MSKFAVAFAVVIFFLTAHSSWAEQRQAISARHVVAQHATPEQPGLFSETSIEKSWQQATQKQRPMLVMFTTPNCYYCKKMLKETYGHPAIQRMLADNTETVLAHATDYKRLVKRLGIRGYPSSLLISPQGEVLDFMHGYLPPADFAKRVTPLLQAQQQLAQSTRAASLPKPLKSQ